MTNYTKALCTLFLASLANIGTCYSCPEQKPLQYKEKLIVNTNDKIRTIIFKNEEEGTKDIKELVGTSEIEEAWAYLPPSQKWIEIGIEGTTKTQFRYDNNLKKITKGYINTKIDSANLEKILKEYDDLIIFHFHPESFSSEAITVLKEAYQKEELTNETYIQQMLLYEFLNCIPSIDDITTMIITSRAFYLLHPHGNTRHKVISKIGIAEYKLTSKGIKEYTSMSNTEFLETVQTLKQPLTIQLGDKCNSYNTTEKTIILKYDCITKLMCDLFNNKLYICNFTLF